MKIIRNIRHIKKREILKKQSVPNLREKIWLPNSKILLTSSDSNDSTA
jgi:hypothetical protein